MSPGSKPSPASPKNGDGPAIALCDVDIGYSGEAVVRGVSLAVEPREMHVLLGESGSGKTTILRAIAGFEPIWAGRIELFDNPVDHPAQRRRPAPPEDRGVGVVFQDYALFPHLDVAGNVAFAMRNRRVAKRRIADRVESLLSQVGLDGLGRRPVAELSGGQQQRVALARALAQEPRIMLLDEPFSNLNRELRSELRERTVAILREQGITAMFVTHDREEAFAIADRISVIHDGALLQTGTPEEIFETPASIEVARSMGEVDCLPAEVTSDGRSARCALGVVSLRSPLPPGSRATLLVRPDQITLRSQRGAEGSSPVTDSRIETKGSADVSAVTPALVERVLYHGSFVEIRLVLADGTRILARDTSGTIHNKQHVIATIAGPVACVPQPSPLLSNPEQLQ